jgi:non-homologous end joining protein Ku
VVDLMAALKKSLGQAADDNKPTAAKKKATAKMRALKPPQAAAKRKRA